MESSVMAPEMAPERGALLPEGDRRDEVSVAMLQDAEQFCQEDSWELLYEEQAAAMKMDPAAKRLMALLDEEVDADIKHLASRRVFETDKPKKLKIGIIASQHMLFPARY